MATLEDLERKLASLDDGVFRVFSSSAAPPTEAELAKVEATAGIQLHPDHRRLLGRFGTLVVEVVESVWPRPKLYDVLPAWQFWFGFHVPGTGEHVPSELSLSAMLSPELKALGVLPVVKRKGARFVGVVSGAGRVGTWAPDSGPVEPLDGNVFDLVLAEIGSLEEGVRRLRVGGSVAEDLMKKGREARWEGSEASDVVDALKEREPAELAPHLPELADALLPPGTLSMGCLDIIAAAGRPAFGTVAQRVYDHFGKDDDPFVIELLGNVHDTSPKALAIYRAGLGGDGDVLEYALAAIQAIADHPAARELVPVMESLFEQGDEDDDRADRLAKIVPVLGHLQAPSFPSRLAAVVETVGDDAFALLCGELKGLPTSTSSLASKMLARFRRLPPGKPAIFNACLALAELGIEDCEHMEPVVLSFAARGGAWEERAKPLLARWGAKSASSAPC